MLWIKYWQSMVWGDYIEGLHVLLGGKFSFLAFSEPFVKNVVLEAFGDSTRLFLSKREIPAFGLYFSCYDLVKETINSQILPTPNQDPTKTNQSTLSPHEWASSALAGGCSGALTWAVIYPFDVIKTRIQTTPLETPLSQRRMSYIVSMGGRICFEVWVLH